MAVPALLHQLCFQRDLVPGGGRLRAAELQLLDQGTQSRSLPGFARRSLSSAASAWLRAAGQPSRHGSTHRAAASIRVLQLVVFILLL